MNSSQVIQKRWITVAAGFALAAVVLLYFYTYSPLLNENFFPACSFKAATGWDCPGCGGQRAFHELIHFRMLNAWRFNPFFILIIPLLLYYIFYFVRRYIYGIPEPDNFLYTWKFGRLFILGVILFMIVRNL